MHTNVNLEAPIGILLFLGAGCLLLVLTLALLYSLLKRKERLTRLTLIAIAGVAASYLGLLFFFSFKSADTVLALNQEKYFCEMDCHLAYSVTEVRETKTLGSAPDPVTANGMFRMITIRTRFDENTITPTRGDKPLYPNSRTVVVFDRDGKKYFHSAEAQAVLEQSQSTGTPLTRPLRPAETYYTTLVFDLPTDIKDPTLLIHEEEFVTRLIIGHENSPLHKKTRFRI